MHRDDEPIPVVGVVILGVLFGLVVVYVLGFLGLPPYWSGVLQGLTTAWVWCKINR